METSETRLIALLPGTFGTGIRIQLETAVLSESHILRYKAPFFGGLLRRSLNDICMH